MNPRKFFACKCLVSCAALFGAAGAAAQTQIALSERDYFEELPVVLSVSRLAQPLDEAPGAVTVIDREMIRQSGVRQIVDLLRLVPGFQVADVPNGSPAAVYHGPAESYPRHMQVLVDGRSQYSPFFVGGVNWNLLPVSIDDIERIEVIRGSNSAAYGSNAVLGVVNIVTRNAQETLGAAAELKAGTGGINDRRIRLGAGGQDVSMRLTAETRQDSGFNNFRDDTARHLIDGRIDWRLGMRDELQLQFGEIATNMQVGSGIAADPARNQKQSQQYVQLGWKRTLSESEELAVRYYRSEERAADDFSFRLYSLYSAAQAALLGKLGIPNYTVPVDYGFRSIRNNLEATHTFSPWRDTRLVWGGELRSDAVRGAQYYGRTDDVSNTVARAFGNLEWRFAPAWIANVGATWEHDTNAKTTLSPRLAVNWHLAPGQTLRAAVSRAYRTPSLFETRGDWAFSSTTGAVLDRKYLMLGTPLPEQITSRELGWLGEFKSLRLTGDVRVFQEKIDNRELSIPTILTVANRELLAYPSTGTADAIYNAQNARIRGVEYQFRWQPFDATRVILNQSFIRMGADMQLPAVSSISPTYDPAKDIVLTQNSAPTHTAALMLMQRLPGGFDLSATYYAVGAMKWSNNTYMPAWQRLDWRLAYPFRMGPTRGELAFTVQGDGKAHVEHAPTEIVTTRSFVTLRLEY